MKIRSKRARLPSENSKKISQRWAKMNLRCIFLRCSQIRLQTSCRHTVASETQLTSRHRNTAPLHFTLTVNTEKCKRHDDPWCSAHRGASDRTAHSLWGRIRVSHDTPSGGRSTWGATYEGGGFIDSVWKEKVYQKLWQKLRPTHKGTAGSRAAQAHRAIPHTSRFDVTGCRKSFSEPPFKRNHSHCQILRSFPPRPGGKTSGNEGESFFSLFFKPVNGSALQAWHDSLKRILLIQ